MKQPAISRFSIIAPVLIAYTFISAGLAQTCPANIPHIQGTWRTLPYLMPINPISATLLHTGKVLIVAGSENDASNQSEGAESYRNAVWDPTGTTQSSVTVYSLNYDVFCSGTVALPDGRTIIIGGTSSYAFTGDNRASIFDPVTQTFIRSQSMADGRWYATATALGDGRVATLSGIKSGGGTNNTVEIYDLKNAGAGWTSPVAAPFTNPPLYPRMFVLPNGKVFFTGHGTDPSIANAWMMDPATASWTQSIATTQDREYGSSVLLPLLPPSYTPKVINFGGGNPATPSTEIVDLSASSPKWTAGPSMSTGRIQMNAVILPNGKILAEGGSVNNEAPDSPGKTADLYDPVLNTISSGGTATYSRLYHSTALLLPDATVASMGSNPPPRGSYEPVTEIYTPPYLFDANDNPITNRPAITGVTPSLMGYNAQFSVTYSSSFPISSAVLIRPGSSTHAFDMEQRLIGLCGPSPQPACSGSGTLTLTSPANSNVAPPGYYMLFLLDNRGVPSVAQFVQLSPYTTTPPKGSITAPTGNVTITAGGSVSFSGSGTNAAKYSWVFPSGSPATSTAQNPGSVTFTTPGVYSVSLTVIDSSGNSDPSPPTRTVTVLPASPDFNITVTPSSGTVTPGQSTTFTVSIQPLTGFNGAVSLIVGSENGFPAGISSGGFSPASISGSGSSTLRMNTTTSAIPFALSLTITGTSGTLSHTASTTLLVNIAAPAGLTVTSATSGQVSLSWTASTGATGYHVKRSLDSGGPYVSVGCPTSTSFTDAGLTNGTTYYYVVSADYTGGPVAGGESADSGQISATPVSGTFTPIRVNAGGPGYTDSLGQVWSADTGFSAGSTFSTTNAISGTADPTLYQTQRWNATTFQYQFGVPSGNYSVTLKYAETYFSATGQRSFNVNINGVAVQTNFDIVAAAGGAFKAIDQTFTVSSSGSITIQFVPVVQNPSISAIQIVQANGINVSVAPPTASLGQSQTQQFTANVTGAPNTTVTWSIAPAGLGTISSTGLYTAPATITATQQVTVKATSNADNVTNGTATVTLNPPTGTFTPIRVNAGGPAYTDSLGQVWSADTGFSAGSAFSTTTGITGTADPTLYQTERWNSTTLQYQFTVPSGSYAVTLKYAEIFFSTTGQRTFNVNINGVAVQTNFDIVAAAGSAFKAIDQTFTVSSSGTITIQFVPVIQNPAINAIQIVQASGINVSVSPPTASLGQSQTQQFTANVTGTGNTAVTWSIAPAGLGAISSTGLYTAPATITTTQQVTVKATSNADNVTNGTATVTLNPPTGSFTPILVNCGGPAYTDSLGQTWSADTGFSAGNAFSISNGITGTADPTLYQTQRWNAATFQYQFTVPSGTYSVTLKYAEIYFTSTGQRTFNVIINGTTVQTNFDVVAAAGAAFTAIDVTFSVTASTTITIQFVPVIQNPAINAIQIVKTG